MAPRSPSPLFSKIRKEIEGIYPRLLAFREDLHRHPELSWKEYRTTEKIQEFLAVHGIDNFRRPLETGGIVDMIFEAEAPFVLLRADIDALPIQDEKKVPYRSERPGVCHACAHDVHTTIIVGVALLLKKLRVAMPYNLRFVFQPAEEPIPSGAPEMIASGALEHVHYALGLHMEPRLPLNTISLKPGWINKQSIRIDLLLGGPGGHSARPNETADLIWIASRLVQDSYQMIYREINLLDSLVMLTFTEIQAAQGYNVIPSDLKLTGTLRLTDSSKKEMFFKKFRRLLRHIEGETGCGIQLLIQEGAPPVHNDPELTARMKLHAEEDFWLPITIDTQFTTPGGDDFSHYSKTVPATMVRFGIQNKKATAHLHEGLFDVPGESIKVAVSFFAHQLLKLERR